MGFETAGFLARIFRLSRRGHHSLLASPAVGCTRPGRTGHSPASGVGPSVTVGSWFSDMRILSVFSGKAGHGTQELVAELVAVEQSGHRPQYVTSASSIEKPWSSDAVRQG